MLLRLTAKQGCASEHRSIFDFGVELTVDGGRANGLSFKYSLEGKMDKTCGETDRYPIHGHIARFPHKSNEMADGDPLLWR